MLLSQPKEWPRYQSQGIVVFILLLRITILKHLIYLYLFIARAYKIFLATATNLLLHLLIRNGYNINLDICIY